MTSNLSICWGQKLGKSLPSQKKKLKKNQRQNLGLKRECHQFINHSGPRMTALPMTKSMRSFPCPIPASYSTESRRFLHARVIVSKAGIYIETHLTTQRKARNMWFLPSSQKPSDLLSSVSPTCSLLVSGLTRREVKQRRKRKLGDCVGGDI